MKVTAQIVHYTQVFVGCGMWDVRIATEQMISPAVKLKSCQTAHWFQMLIKQDACDCEADFLLKMPLI